jgi:hypothetical protein
MDVPRFVNRGGRKDEPGDISVMITYWVYRRICESRLLMNEGSSANDWRRQVQETRSYVPGEVRYLGAGVVI